MPNAQFLDIRFGAVAPNAQASLGGAVRWDVIASGQIVAGGYAASVTAANTAATAVANTYSVVG